MSSKCGGGGGGGGAEGSRVSIPDNAKKTILSIREITGKQHSDEEIYAILKECSMDPNETAQKLLYMDTFHDVKRKRDKKKEASVLFFSMGENKTAGTQRRGGCGSRGNYYTLSGKDAGGGKNAFARRENGVNRTADRGSMPSPASQKVKNNAALQMTKTSTAISNGSTILPNGISSHGRGPQSSINGIISETKDSLPVNKPKTISAQTAVREPPAPIPAQSFGSLIKGQEKSASNLSTSSTSATSPIVSRDSVAVDTIQSEVGLQQEAAELNRIQGNKQVRWDMDISKTEKMASEVSISMHGEEEPSKSEVAEQVKQSMPVEQVVTSEVAAVTDKANPQLLADSNVHNGQHVIFPTHFQVSEALKNGLTFGSFDASFGQVSKHNNLTDLEINTARPVETSQGVDETVGEPSSRSQGILPAGEGGNADQQQAPRELEKVTESDGNVSSDTNLKVDQSNHEMHLHPDSNQSTIPNVPCYGLGFLPASTTNVPQFDGPEARPHDVSRLTNFISGNPPAPSGSSTPPIQSSVAAAPQAVHLFRQPFPPNYFPYPHYLSPFYMHPMHQFLNPTGLPQQPSTGNVYMPPGVTPPGVKFPLPQFKPGTNAGNPAHLAIPSGYGPLTSPPIGFNLPLPSVTSGSSSSKEDIAALQLKENQIYTTGPLNESSALWMPAPGQDLSNLQVNSLYNLSLHGPQLPFSPAQAGHGAFAGLYQSPPQTMAAPSNVNTLLQQSQSTAAAVGSVGPPSGTYQQPQLAQVNWKTNY
ncbi:GBF-interacting protein 1-like isoform X1 [Gossypium raimondii]|uniref:GBF-interacting protein 1-like isoform X1 n=1 Tax=Gossypium raimondii TaxID=29730 RepID=UPI00227A35BB|nr:GBF-interacting protein 1-like isoform X1 [Gossypium raimondii]